jgi:hypothetical protein
MSAPILEDTNTIKARLSALLEAVISKTKINPLFLPTIKNLANNFLKEASEDDLKTGIIELRGKYIPWILNEAPDENPHKE